MTTKRHCDTTAFPVNGDVLTLTLLPNKTLEGPKGHGRILAGMRGVEKHVIETIDGFGYTPSYSSYLETNLVMVAAALGNVNLIRYWVENCEIDVNVRNHCMRSALLEAIGDGATETRDYLLSLPNIRIGVPEAAALGYRDLIPDLIREFDEKLAQTYRHGLSGAEVAFIFSGLSGDTELVLELMKNVKDVNVGLDTQIGNIGFYAVESLNKDLVTLLVKEYGVKFQGTVSHDSVLFKCLHDPTMLDFLLNDLKVDSLDILSKSRNTLLDSALLNRNHETAEYLLDQDPIDKWVARSEYLCVCNSLFMHNPLSTTRRLLTSVTKGSVDDIMRQALRSARADIVQELIDTKGADLSKEPPKNWISMLEIAIQSGCAETVRFVLDKVPRLGNRVHENGYSPLVTAAQMGSSEVFKLLSGAAPELLNKPVWDGMSLLMVACTSKSNDIANVLLEEEFYEKHCRGKLLDANSTDDSGETALSFAISNGCVEDAELILSKKEFLRLTEIQDSSKVSNLFLKACKRARFADYLDCFERHGLVLGDDLDSSLTLTAAENGVLVGLAPEELKRLLALDEMVGLNVPDDVLLCTFLQHAPEWAVNNGGIAELVKDVFAGKPVMRSHAVLNQVVAQSDLQTLEFCRFDSSSVDKKQLILQALKNANMSANKKIPHTTSTRRRTVFIQWLMQQKSDVSNEKQSKAVLEAVINANLCIKDVMDVAGLSDCSRQELNELLQLATTYCQLENVKTLVKSFPEDYDFSKMGKNGSHLILVALDEKKVPDEAEPFRLSLIQFLMERCNLDLSAPSNDGEHAGLKAAALGDYNVFSWVADHMERERLLAVNDQGNNVLHSAVKSGHIQIVSRATDELGSDICGPEGETALHCAAAAGKLGLVRYLVESRKSNLMARDSTNRLPMDYAFFCEDEPTRFYLEGAYGETVRPVSTTSHRAIVQGWLREIGKAIGRSLSLNASGICAFTYEAHTIVIEVPETSGSFFIYTTFDGKTYDIQDDTLSTLLRIAEPGGNEKVCPALDPRPNKETGASDAIISSSYRVEELSQQDFRVILENFIEVVLIAATRLTLCAARRELREKLLGISTSDDGSAMVQEERIKRVLNHIGSFAVDPPKSHNVNAADRQVFRKYLSSQMLAISKEIGKIIVVNDRGLCAFTYDELTITMEPYSRLVVAISATMWKKSEDGILPEAVSRRALHLNYLQQETRGGMMMIDPFSSDEEIFFMYCDRVDLTPQHFRNVLENFIDVALSLRRRIRDANEDHNDAGAELEEYLRRRKAESLNDLRIGQYGVIGRILSISLASKRQSLIEQLVWTVSDTLDKDLWASFTAYLMPLVSGTDVVDVDSLRKTLMNRALARGLADDKTLETLINGAPPNFEREMLFRVFISNPAIEDGSAVEIAEKLVTSYRARCKERDEEPTDKIIDDWANHAVNLMNTAQHNKDISKTITCLQWIFGKAMPDDLENPKSVRRLVNHAASEGNLELLRYLMDRLPHVVLEEETLMWACTQNHKEVVKYLLEHCGTAVSRERSIEAAAAAGNVEILMALGIGTSLEGNKPEEEEGTAGGGDAVSSQLLLSATQMAITNCHWDAMAHLVSDRRLTAPLGPLLKDASQSSNPAKAIRVLLDSPLAVNQAYEYSVPWEAREHVVNTMIVMPLRVIKSNNLPMEIAENLWSFVHPQFEATPEVSSADNFLSVLCKPLERDLNIGEISRNGNTFRLPGIGSLTIGGGLCQLSRSFDVSGLHISPQTPLAMSAQLGGCFLASGNLSSVIWLKRVVSLHHSDGPLSYRDLCATVRTFQRVSGIIDDVISKAKKIQVLASAPNLSAVAPSFRTFTQVLSQKDVREGGRQYTYTSFTNSRLIRVTTPCDFQVDMDVSNTDSNSTSSETSRVPENPRDKLLAKLLDSNMIVSDQEKGEIFYCLLEQDSSTSPPTNQQMLQAAAYVLPQNGDEHGHRILKKLCAMAQKRVREDDSDDAEPARKRIAF